MHPPTTLSRWPFSFPELFSALLRHSNFLVCPSAMVRTSVYKDDIQGWRGELFGSSADLDIWLRIARRSGLGLLPARLMKYRVTKAHAECRHRAHAALPIMDIRIFNYISETLDSNARFLVTDAVRAIRERTVLKTSAERTVRDYLHARDFCALIDAVLAAPPTNDVVDCYSKAPIEKTEMLQALQAAHGLRYEVSPVPEGINATGRKPCYYSLNRRASRLGYRPELTSLDGVLEAVRGMLG